MERIKQYEPLWGSWYVEEKLGSGGFGAVYKVSKQAGGVKEYAAVKLIRNTFEEKQRLEMKRIGMSDDEISRSLDKQIKKAEDEIIHMSSLKGVSEIVSIEDYSIFKLKDGSGYDLLIRMELLTSLDDYLVFSLKGQPMPVEEVCHLGIDLCTALEYCEQTGIVHKDIKPSNIFINTRFMRNKYELGDFGLARRADQSTVMSKSGTANYISPEVWKMEKAGFPSDIYSLGLTLYTLLNHNRLPFYPSYPEYVDYDGEIEAVSRRLNGEEIPPPDGDRGRLWEIIRRACRYRKGDRYQHAAEMKEELIQYLADQRKEKAENIEKTRLEETRQAEAMPAREKDSFDRWGREAETKADGGTNENSETWIGKEGGDKPDKKDSPGNLWKMITGLAVVAIFAVAIVLVLKFNKDNSEGAKETSKDTAEASTGNAEDSNSEKTQEDSVAVGDQISFGSYEQDGDTSNGKEEIIWKVVDESDGSLLLVSEAGLDAKEYHDEWVAMNWERCSLRNWVNGDFYNEAFSEEEKSRIKLTEVKAEDNPEYGTDAGKDTQDKVFLLSISEAEQYFDTDRSRQCYPTAYAIDQGVDVDSELGTCDWWLRSPGGWSDAAVVVAEDGVIEFGGVGIINNVPCIRPALWISP